MELILPTGSDIKTSIFFGPVFLAEITDGEIWSTAVELEPIFNILFVVDPSEHAAAGQSPAAA